MAKNSIIMCDKPHDLLLYIHIVNDGIILNLYSGNSETAVKADNTFTKFNAILFSLFKENTVFLFV